MNPPTIQHCRLSIDRFLSARRLDKRCGLIDLLQFGVALVAIGVGALSLLRQSSLRHVLESCMNIHALFCSLLIGFSLLRLLRHCQHSSLEAFALSILARDHSRLLYLVLYGALGLRQIIGVARLICYGEPIDFHPENRFFGGSAFGGFDVHNDSQAFLASAIAALLFIRVLLYGMWLRVADRRGKGSDCHSPTR